MKRSIAFRLELEQIEALRKEAVTQQTTVTEVIRRALLGVFIRQNVGVVTNPVAQICECNCESGKIHSRLYEIYAEDLIPRMHA